MRKALVALAAVASLVVVPAARGQEQAPAGESRVRLASQTSWVGPGQELVLRVAVTTPRPPADVEVAVAVHRRVTSRTEFARTIEGRPRGAPVSVTSRALSELTVDVGGAVVVRLPVQDPALPPDGTQLRLRDEGVYPVRVELREAGGGTTLAELLTHLVYVTPPEEGGFKLGAALVLPVHAPPALQPDGSRRLSAGAAGSLAELARALEAHPAVPLTIAPTPETLEALASSQRAGDGETLAALRRGAAGRQTTPAPYVSISLPAMLAAGLAGEAAAQMDRGSETIERTLGARPDTRTWVAGDRLDEPTVARLRQQQVDRMVIPEDRMPPVDRPVTLAQPFELEVGTVRRPHVLAEDRGLAAHFAPTDDPVLAAHRLLADLAVVYLDRPGHVRAVVAAAPPSWRPTTAFLDTLLEGLASSPILYGSTLDGVFSTVPPATTPEGPPLVRRLGPVPAGPGGTLPATTLAAARRRLEAFASMLEPANPLDDSIEELLLVAQEANLRPRQRGAYLDAVEKRIDAQTSLIQVPENPSIRLTARNGEIPVTILSQAGYPVHVRVEVDSVQLAFPEGSARPVDLNRRNTTERFPVKARTSGAFPLRVRLVSPDGHLVVGRSQFTVRSTAASGVGMALSLGAGGFLVVWWARHHTQTRRNRRLVPA